MKSIGIICEYNPFHNGHLYHLKKVKEMFPDYIIILVLNGYFLQRGDISIISKENKTKLSLLSGVDIVLELPFVFGTQSADIFANQSITMLENLNCEYVVFGSECNDLKLLNKITDYTLNNSLIYNEDVKKYLAAGLNYPTALAKAINIDFNFNSNDLLGISYIKSIKKNNFKIKPMTIQRTNNYLDTTSSEDIISATNVRKKLINNEMIHKYVPEITLPMIQNITLNQIFTQLKYKIITEHDLSIYLDVDEGIEYRLKKVITECNNFDELLELTKSKRYTYNKLRRMFIHILVGLTKEDNKKIKLDYIKILGFNSDGKKYLNKIKKDISIPLTVDKDSLVYKYEMKSALIYDMASNNNNIEFEIKNKPISY